MLESTRIRNLEESQEVRIPSGKVTLGGTLIVPPGALGIVLFAHGSGSSRHSPRNQYVARTIREAGIGTLLFDLLTPEEEASEVHTRHLRFDIELLAARLVDATLWVTGVDVMARMSVGYFGASTGGGAAAALGDMIGAVVSRAGRPDLAGAALNRVQTPTLLIVGGRDQVVIQVNREAFAQLACRKELKIVPGATHLFEEPGALEEVARLASDWFRKELATGSQQEESNARETQ
jgi:putative phosphoribosyl transferase